jgi:hypothetical protein
MRGQVTITGPGRPLKAVISTIGAITDRYVMSKISAHIRETTMAIITQFATDPTR